MEKFARSSFSGGSSALTAASSADAAFCRARVSAAAAGAIVGFRRLPRPGQRDEARLAGVERREIGGEFFRQRRKLIDWRGIFARGGAQGKQPFLDLLQRARVEFRGAQRLIQRLLGEIERVQRRVQGPDRRFDQMRRLRLAPLQPAQGGRERGQRRPVAGDALIGVAQIAGDFLRLLHRRALGGKLIFLARTGAELRQFLMGVGEIIGLLARGLDRRRFFTQVLFRLAQSGMGGAGLRDQSVMAAEGVEQGAMDVGIDQGAVVVLAVDFHQCAADGPQAPGR